MSKPYYSLRHVESMADLPANLTVGRIYFVDDEQVLVINHGNGLPPVVYGGKPGPQGPAAQPQALIQEQIDTLVQTALRMQAVIWDEGEMFRETYKNLSEHSEEMFSQLRKLSNRNATAVMNLAYIVKRTFDNYDSAITTLARAVSNLYPDQSQQAEELLQLQGSSENLLAQNNG